VEGDDDRRHDEEPGSQVDDESTRTVPPSCGCRDAEGKEKSALGACQVRHTRQRAGGSE